MDLGLYIAASGMLAEQIRQDQIANDHANASTPGCKGDRTAQRSFSDLLFASSTTGRVVGRDCTAGRSVRRQTEPVTAAADTAVHVTVCVGAELADSCVNLHAPIVISVAA